MIKKYKKSEVMEFLKESNAIEQIYDDDSLQQAWFAWQYLSKQKELTHDVVKKTHKILMLHQNLLPSDKGYYRNIMVYIGGHSALNAIKIPEAMDEWFKDVKTSLKVPGFNGRHFQLDHISYEKVHPFMDGNGRTGRMFMNWERMQAGLPILIIHADWPKINGEQDSYYRWFRRK